MNISTLIMKTYIKYWLMAVTTVMVCTNHVRAQEFYRENETAMHIFHELDRMFPKRYLEQRWMTGAQFWVQYWFEDHEDYEEHRPKITEIFDLLDATPFLHKHTEETDSGDIMRKTYAMSLRSDIQGQQDFLKLEASPTGVFFYYQTTNRFAQAEMMPYPTKPSSQNSKNCSTNTCHAEKRSNKKCISTEHTDV